MPEFPTFYTSVTNMFDCFGFINSLLQKFDPSMEVIDWFQSPSLALTVLIIGSLWSGFGINVLYFSAALTNIPDELYEALEKELNAAYFEAYPRKYPVEVPSVYVLPT